MLKAITTCHLCGKRYDMMKAKHIFRHPYCNAWPILNHGELVSLNMYDTETELDWEIEEAWRAKVRNIIAWEGPFPSFKIKCWECGGWFFSEHNIPGTCYKCSTIKEEVC